MKEKLFFICDFQDLLIEKILNRLSNFIRFNPDDLNRNLLKRVIKRSISELTNLPIEEIDKRYESYAKIRLYSEGKKSFRLKTGYCNILIPDLDIGVINQIQAENCYIIAFFSKMNEFLRGTVKLEELIRRKDIERLKDMLNTCTQYATYAAIYNISNQKIPNKEELEKFLNSI